MASLQDLFGQSVCKGFPTDNMITATTLDDEKRVVEFTLKMGEYADVELIDLVEKRIANALELSNSRIVPHFDKELFSVDRMGDIFVLTKRAIPIANGFFDNAKVAVDGSVLTINLINGGEKIVNDASCAQFISSLIKERFSINFTVDIISEPTDDSFTLEEMQNEIDKKAVQRVKAEQVVPPPGERKVLEGFPIVFETLHPIYGAPIKKNPIHIKDVHFDSGRVVIWGDIFDLDVRATKDGRSNIITFNLTDYTSSYSCKIFEEKEKMKTMG